MKVHFLFFLLVMFFSLNLLAVEVQKDGPMNADWFYKNDAYKSANMFHQGRKWEKAAGEYKKLLTEGAGTEYDQNMARLNLAACKMAQGKASKNWAAFDKLVGIEEKKQFIHARHDDPEGKSVLVLSDKIGIGDIFHFLKAIKKLKKQTSHNVFFSVRNFLKPALKATADKYEFSLVGEKDPQPETTYKTHLISLLGILEMRPYECIPKHGFYTDCEKAIGKVKNVVHSMLADDGIVAVVFVGEDCQTTLIGGKQLPYEKNIHGRHLSSESFNRLLKKKPKLHIIDCARRGSSLEGSEEVKDRIVLLPDEEYGTIQALGVVMSKISETQPGRMIGLVSDNGPANVFTRHLSSRSQDNVAYIIPNPEEYDMRMEGEGEKYKQMFSNCWVYKSKSPHVDDQSVVIEEAYDDLMGWYR